MNTARLFLFTLFISLLPFLTFAQVRAFIDYSKADSLAMSVKCEDLDIDRLTRQLTKPFSEPELKARAIFRWITYNIAYDYKFYNRYTYKGKEQPSFYCEGDSVKCELKKQVWENEYINKVVANKKAVCQGYSMLFKKMCGIAGIEAEVVPGYIRTQYYEIGNMGVLDHAWNMVRLNGAFYLLDATWAAGGCGRNEDGKLVSFQRHFDEYYWLTSPEEFARNHFPENEKWGLPAHYTKEKFSANPYYSQDELDKIRLIAPASGIVNVKRGDSIRFKLRYTGNLEHLQINSNVFQNPDIWTWEYITKRKMIRVPDTAAIKKLQYVKYLRRGDTYEFAYAVNDYGLEYVDIMFDNRQVMRFKVNVNR